MGQLTTDVYRPRPLGAKAVSRPQPGVADCGKARMEHLKVCVCNLHAQEKRVGLQNWDARCGLFALPLLFFRSFLAAVEAWQSSQRLLGACNVRAPSRSWSSPLTLDCLQWPSRGFSLVPPSPKDGFCCRAHGGRRLVVDATYGARCDPQGWQMHAWEQVRGACSLSSASCSSCCRLAMQPSRQTAPEPSMFAC